jgi:hypothetical protein
MWEFSYITFRYSAPVDVWTLADCFAKLSRHVQSIKSRAYRLARPPYVFALMG